MSRETRQAIRDEIQRDREGDTVGLRARRVHRATKSIYYAIKDLALSERLLAMSHARTLSDLDTKRRDNDK